MKKLDIFITLLGTTAVISIGLSILLETGSWWYAGGWFFSGFLGVISIARALTEL